MVASYMSLLLSCPCQESPISTVHRPCVPLHSLTHPVCSFSSCAHGVVAQLLMMGLLILLYPFPMEEKTVGKCLTLRVSPFLFLV